MSKTKIDPIEEVRDLLKNQLILSLFSLNVSQGDISKKLHLDKHAVNALLKGIKKNNYEKK